MTKSTAERITALLEDMDKADTPSPESKQTVVDLVGRLLDDVHRIADAAEQTAKNSDIARRKD